MVLVLALVFAGGFVGWVIGHYTGNSSATKEYFSTGAVYTSSTVADLIDQIRYLVDHYDTLSANVKRFYTESSAAWTDRLRALDRMIEASE